MDEAIRNAGIVVLFILTVSWFAGFLAMMFRPNPNPYGWLGLLGGAGLIVVIFAMLIRADK